MSVNVVMNADKSLLGVVKLGNKDDVKLAISSLHHKKIGYKRLNVAVALTPITNSPKYILISLSLAYLTLSFCLKDQELLHYYDQWKHKKLHYQHSLKSSN